MGIPVISATGTGTIDAVSDGYSGILIPIKNKLKLEEAMKKMMTDESYRLKFSENGINWTQNFEKEMIWAGMNDLYKEI